MANGSDCRSCRRDEWVRFYAFSVATDNHKLKEIADLKLQQLHLMQRRTQREGSRALTKKRRDRNRKRIKVSLPALYIYIYFFFF